MLAKLRAVVLAVVLFVLGFFAVLGEESEKLIGMLNEKSDEEKDSNGDSGL